MSAGRSGRQKLGFDPARASRQPRDEQSLLHELWQISHFGWIPQAAIRRSLIISCGGQEIPAAALAERLRRLLERGWAEQRRDAALGDCQWRLTDSGRSARAS
jgi:hypothetical protein